MNLSQIGWALLIIGNMYTANDNGKLGVLYFVIALIVFIVDILINK